MRASSLRDREVVGGRDGTDSQSLDGGELDASDSAVSGDASAASGSGAEGGMMAAPAATAAGHAAGADAHDGGASGASGASAGVMASGGAGGGLAGASGAAGSPVAEPPSCGDTTTDAKHCGTCNHDCSAAAATVSCTNSLCTRACEPGFADCNGDLDRGTAGDGCETNIGANIMNCGGCTFSCQGVPGGVPNCEERRCTLASLDVGDASGVDELHGSATGGGAYQHLCGHNNVLVGLEVATDEHFLYGIAAVCAELSLTGTPAQYLVTMGTPQVLPALGNDLETPFPATHLQCPAGAVVTSVSGGTWYYGENQAFLSVRQMALQCSQLSLDAQGQLQFSPSDFLRMGAELEYEEAFTDECPAGHVVVGFVGRSGAYLDAVSTQCAPLTVTRQVFPWAAGAQP